MFSDRDYLQACKEPSVDEKIPKLNMVSSVLTSLLNTHCKNIKDVETRKIFESVLEYSLEVVTEIIVELESYDKG